MSDANTLIPTAQGFYRQLAADNTKAWWQDNRGTYDDVLKPGAQALLEGLTPHLATLADAPIKTKLFRPHRDVRFSKDKAPYNTHLHMMWQLEGDAPQTPVFFFGIGTDYVTAGAGMMGFEKPVLENWRKFVDLDTDRILGIVSGLEGKGFALREPALKRVPSAYAPDHVAGHLLRMKGVTASCDIGQPDRLEATLKSAFDDLWPLNALLLQVSES